MKQIGLLLILVICTSCKKTNANRDENPLSSYAVSEKVAEFHSPTEDTIKTLKDVARCDSMIRLEKNTNKLFSLYQRKASILVGIGHIKEAYYVQGTAMNLLPENDVRHLEYEAIGAYLQHDLDRYSQLLRKAINEYKKHPDDAEMILNMATCYTLLGDDKSSRSVLKNFLRHKYDQTISFANEDYTLFKEQVLEGRKQLVGQLK